MYSASLLGIFKVKAAIEIVERTHSLFLCVSVPVCVNEADKRTYTQIGELVYLQKVDRTCCI